jgi:hypothetical protein
MGGPGSGGWNRLTNEEHMVRGTYRRDRHERRAAWLPPAVAAARAALAEEIESRAMALLERAHRGRRWNLRRVHQALAHLKASNQLWRGIL